MRNANPIRNYCFFCGVLFATVTAIHFLRFVQGWDVNIAGIPVPLWASGAAIVVTGILSVLGFKYGTHREKELLLNFTPARR